MTGLVAGTLAAAIAIGVAWSRTTSPRVEARGLAPLDDARREDVEARDAALLPHRDDSLECAPVAGHYRGRRISGKTVAETVDELHRRMKTGRHPYLCLTRLDHFDNAEADKALLTLFADERFDVSRHSERFASLLEDVDDPRVGEIAMRYLREGLEERSAVELSGYLKLVATKHGPSGRQYAFELLTDTKFDFGSKTSSCVAALRGSRYAPQFIAHARAHPRFASRYFDGLMRWKRFGTRMLVRAVAFDLKEDEGLRRTAMESYGRHVDRSEFTTVLSLYWNPREDQDRQLGLTCVAAAAASRRLRGKEVLTYGLPVLEDALFSHDELLRGRALAIFENSSTFRRDEGRAILARFAADESRAARERGRARRALEL